MLKNKLILLFQLLIMDMYS